MNLLNIITNFLRFSRNNRQASSGTRRTPSSSQTQNASEISSRSSSSTVNLSTATTGVSSNTSGSSGRNHINTATVINPMPLTIPTLEHTSSRDTNAASVDARGRSADTAETTSRENGRTRSSSSNRRRNRRRRRRARSAAGNTTSSRTNHQHLDQNELQRTSLAGNYNLPRASTTGTSSNSGVNSNRTNASSTISDAVTPGGPEDEANKCQVRHINSRNSKN